jgi:hypothetical protein
LSASIVLDQRKMAPSSDPWPPPEGLSTVVVPRADAILTNTGSATIAAPAAFVFAIVRDTGTYPTWNTFVPRVTIHSQPEGTDPASTTLEKGTAMTFHAVMDSSKPGKAHATQLRVTDVSTPAQPTYYVPCTALDKDPTYTTFLNCVYRISWASEGGLVARGLRTERFHEVIVIDSENCEVRTWENHGGVLARTVKWLYQETLRVKFQEWCDDLKKYAEEKYSESKAKPEA